MVGAITEGQPIQQQGTGIRKQELSEVEHSLHRTMATQLLCEIQVLLKLLLVEIFPEFSVAPRTLKTVELFNLKMVICHFNVLCICVYIHVCSVYTCGCACPHTLWQS